MRKGSHAHKRASATARRSGVSKFLILFLAFALAFGGAIGGSLAWLMAETDSVVNTFTYGNIEIDLTETDPEGDDPNNNEYEMIPGATITKDPVVTVYKGSEKSWLFVELAESENFGDFLSYEMADGWFALEGEDGVWYRMVDKALTDLVLPVLKENEVAVKEDVTKEMLEALDADPDNTGYPTLTITAYAVQRDAIDSAAEAWALVRETENPES